MSVIHINKGKDIKLKGAADKKVIEASLPTKAAVQPHDFRGLRPRLLAKEDATVKVGEPIIEDKNNQDIKVVSPVSGKVVAVNRGAKRALLEVVIETDGQQSAFQCEQYSTDQISGLSREDVIKQMLEVGVWVCLRQRPFSIIAHVTDKPKSIFVQAMNTEPLALDVDAVLDGQEEIFQTGLDIIKKLTDGDVHLCCDSQAKSSALLQAKNASIHQFSGAHPTGNVSTHIHYIDLIHKGEVVWYVRAEDVIRIAKAFLTGQYSPEKVVAVTGEGASDRVYKKTIVGAPLSELTGDKPTGNMRYISGSILAGTNVGVNGFVCFYDSQITVIPEGGRREFMGWINPGFNKYSFTKTFVSSFIGKGDNVALDTDKNGSDRAIVLNHIYDDYNTLDVMTYFLLRAVISGDIEEAEKLGILECDEEDFALATFVCPSKTDVGGIIRDGLDLIEKEG